VPFLTASWTPTGTSDTWYSLFVHVPSSQMIIELVGKEQPVANTAPNVALEARVSPRNIARFSSTAKESLHMLYATSVSRATSNMTAVHRFYTDVIGATVVHRIEANGVSRRCYQWGTALSDVCFVHRVDSSSNAFSVVAFERMLWSVHAANLLAPTDGDKYNDNHFAADLQISGDPIVTYMSAHNPYPISSSSWWAYACAQSYLIDPTGWTIQTDLQFSSSYPGCTDAARAALVEAAAAAAQPKAAPTGGCKKMENPTCKGIDVANATSKECVWSGCKRCHDETTYACDECCTGCSLAHDPTKGIGYCAAPSPKSAPFF